MSSSDSSMPDAVELSLDAYLHECWPKGSEDVRRFLAPVLEELAALHRDAGFHGGVQPAAFRFSSDGGLNREYFLAFRRRADGTIREEVPHAFRAPETFDGSGQDARVDCYAIGALLYKILTGSAPAPANRRSPNDLPLTADRCGGWPASLLDLTNRCLALAKEERIVNAQEIQATLAKDAPIAEPPPIPLPLISPEKGTETVLLSNIPETTSLQTSSDALSAAAIESAPVSALPSELLPPITSTQQLAAHHLDSSKTALPSSSSPAPANIPAPAPVSSPPPMPLPVKLDIAQRLPNASVGKVYRRNARDLFAEHADRINLLSARLPENSGLSFDRETGIIEGTPTTAGEFKITLAYQVVPASSGRPELTHEVALTINPDPSSLWQKREPAPGGPFAKPHEDKANLDTQHLVAIAASLRGRSHAHEGKYRDDDFGMRYVEQTGWYVFVAADGAGSAKYSRRGSQLACEIAIAHLVEQLAPGNDLDEALAKLGAQAAEDDAREKLRRKAFNFFSKAAYEAFLAIYKEAQAQEKSAAPRDFATTFISVIARRVENRWFFASFSVGDGGAAVMQGPGTIYPLTRADSGEFAGQTVFLTTSQLFQDTAALLARTQAVFCDDFRYLAAMTDGVSDPLFMSDAAFGSVEAWEEFEKKVAQGVNIDALQPGAEDALLKWLEFPSPGNHDDRTLILAVPKRGGASV